MAEKHREFPGFLYKGTNPTHEYTQWPHLLIPSPWALGFHYMNLGGHNYSDHNSLKLHNYIDSNHLNVTSSINSFAAHCSISFPLLSLFT